MKIKINESILGEVIIYIDELEPIIISVTQKEWIGIKKQIILNEKNSLDRILEGISWMNRMRNET